MYLKQSTASQAVLIGPFLDATDGVTAETGLTISAADIRLSKNGANIVSKNSGGGTHDENGWYQITLDATDTNTVGRLQIHVNESGALPVWAEFQVLEEAVYDAFFASSATGLLPANVTQVGGYAPYIDLTVTDSSFTPTSTQFEISETSPFSADDIPIGVRILFPDSGDGLYGHETFILDWDNTNKRFTVRAMPSAPSNGDIVRVMLT